MDRLRLLIDCRCTLIRPLALMCTFGERFVQVCVAVHLKTISLSIHILRKKLNTKMCCPTQLKVLSHLPLVCLLTRTFNSAWMNGGTRGPTITEKPPCGQAGQQASPHWTRSAQRSESDFLICLSRLSRLSGQCSVSSFCAGIGITSIAQDF